MTDRRDGQAGPELPGLEVAVSQEALKEAEKFVEAEEGAAVSSPPPPTVPKWSAM